MSQSILNWIHLQNCGSICAQFSVSYAAGVPLLISLTSLDLIGFSKALKSCLPYHVVHYQVGCPAHIR